MCESSPKGDKKKEQAPMRFYTPQHSHYCGIDLHARTMYLCILNHAGAIVLHRNMKADPDSFLKAIAPFRDQIVVAVECIFTWYWLAVANTLRDNETAIASWNIARSVHRVPKGCGE